MTEKDGADPVHGMKEGRWGTVEIQLQSSFIWTLDESRQCPASADLLSATGTH